MKVKLHNCLKKGTIQDCLIFLTNMLLCDKIRLSEIPQSLRILDVCTYFSALRASRNISTQHYKEDLEIMKKDFAVLPLYKRKKWMHYYSDYKEAVMYCKK